MQLFAYFPPLRLLSLTFLEFVMVAIKCNHHWEILIFILSLQFFLYDVGLFVFYEVSLKPNVLFKNQHEMCQIQFQLINELMPMHFENSSSLSSSVLCTCLPLWSFKNLITHIYIPF